MAMLLRRCSVALLLTACRPSAPSNPEQVDPVLVRGAGVVVTAGDLKDRLVLEPAPVRDGLKDPQRKRAYLAQVIDEELLLAEARRQKLDEVPEFRAAVRSMLLQQLWQARARERSAAGPVDAAQQQAERLAWLEELRAAAKLAPQQAAIDAFVPSSAGD